MAPPKTSACVIFACIGPRYGIVRYAPLEQLFTTSDTRLVYSYPRPCRLSCVPFGKSGVRSRSERPNIFRFSAITRSYVPIIERRRLRLKRARRANRHGPLFFARSPTRHDKHSRFKPSFVDYIFSLFIKYRTSFFAPGH